MIQERNLLKIIEKQLTLSSRFRSIERMRSSSRRKTALEVALKVGGWNEEESRTIRRVVKAHKAMRAWWPILDSESWATWRRYAQNCRDHTSNTSTTSNNNSNRNVNVSRISITGDTDAPIPTFAIGRAKGVWSRERERPEETGR